MVRSHTLYSVTLRQLLLSAPLLMALSVPLAAHTQVQKTDERLEQAAKAIDAVTQGPGAAIGGLHGDVTGGPVGLAIDGKGGYVLAEAREKDKKQPQLTQWEREREKERIERKKDKNDDEDDDKKRFVQREREREREREKERIERKKDKNDDEDDDKKLSPHKIKHKHKDRHDDEDDKRWSRY